MEPILRCRTTEDGIIGPSTTGGCCVNVCVGWDKTKHEHLTVKDRD